jgi:hypothetical protein
LSGPADAKWLDARLEPRIVVAGDEPVGRPVRGGAVQVADEFQGQAGGRFRPDFFQLQGRVAARIDCKRRLKSVARDG